uniref:Major facilitator superfamily (MFS) profile domain-containing protein n=1 Tax=Amphimedon queenslandica TaxID=400682 RepID=A0A1X7TT77_AMPQE
MEVAAITVEISFCVSVAVHTVDFGWRIALGLQCVLAVVLIIGMIFLPETPRWLVKKGKSKKADKTLHRLRKDYTEEEIKEELNDIEFTVLNSNNSLMDAFTDVFRWRILERCCCPWSNACRVRTAQEEDTVAIVGIKNENKDDTSDEAEDDENESLIKDTDVLESSLSAKFDK